MIVKLKTSLYKKWSRVAPQRRALKVGPKSAALEPEVCVEEYLSLKEKGKKNWITSAVKREYVRFLDFVYENDKTLILEILTNPLLRHSNAYSFAILESHQKLLEWLVHKIDINLEDKSGKSPLNIAIEYHAKNQDEEDHLHTLETIAFLIEMGANICKKNSRQPSPMELAVQRCNIEIVKLLLNSDAEPSTPTIENVQNHASSTSTMAQVKAPNNHENEKILEIFYSYGYRR